jgi:hypothetical protein
MAVWKGSCGSSDGLSGMTLCLIDLAEVGVLLDDTLYTCNSFSNIVCIVFASLTHCIYLD